MSGILKVSLKSASKIMNFCINRKTILLVQASRIIQIEELNGVYWQIQKITDLLGKEEQCSMVT